MSFDELRGKWIQVDQYLLYSNARWWFQIFFYVHPYLGEMIQFDEHIFQIGLKPPTRMG